MAKKLTLAKSNEKSVKLGLLIDNNFVFAFNTILGKEHSPSLSYKLLTIHEAISVHQKRYESMRKELISKHGKKDADGNVLMNEDKSQFIMEDKEGFDRDWQDLLGVDVVVPSLPLSLIGENINISPALLQPLVRTIFNPDL